jgi:hypothetical protein
VRSLTDHFDGLAPDLDSFVDFAHEVERQRSVGEWPAVDAPRLCNRTQVQLARCDKLAVSFGGLGEPGCRFGRDVVMSETRCNDLGLAGAAA